MPVPLTEYGREALTRICCLHTLVFLIPADNQAFNERLHQEFEDRKGKVLARFRTKMQPHALPNQSVVEAYIGRDGSERNVSYTAALEKFVAEPVLCSCVDTYHWYLRRVLEAALTEDRAQIDVWKDALKLSAKRIAAVKSAPDLSVAVSAIFRGSEEPFRTLAHQFLNVPDLAIIPKAVVVRNCIVHELGEDRSGKVATAIAENNELGVALHGGRVIVPVVAAYEISGRFISDISIMDQALANVLHLATDPSPLATFGRAFS